MWRPTTFLLLSALVLCSSCYLSHSPEDVRDGGVELRFPERFCESMDVSSLSLCTVGVPTYWWWDGETCQVSICACSGTDCGDVFLTEGACTEAFSGCRP